MGSWVTLHLLDVNKLYNEVIPSLKADNEVFRDNVIKYLGSFRTGGMGYMSEDELKKNVSET
ncbi:MAG: hypothetical protein ACJATI_004193 [Halioglobus sp.]|jgi:hypothetical protein